MGRPKKIYDAEYYETHKQKKKEQYYKRRTEEYVENFNRKKRDKIKNMTDIEYVKYNRLKNWKANGMIIDDNVINKYINTKKCELCNVEFAPRGSLTGNRKCLDHQHSSGYVRFVCCIGCNSKLSKIDKLKNEMFNELHRYYFTQILPYSS
jgi:hypothetical protein